MDDAISQAIADRRVTNISPAENFRLSTIDNLNDLDPESASAARQLSAFIEPPTQEDIVGILGSEMNTVRWEGVRSRLERARIFTTGTDGSPWFHEVRRRCIWESLSPPLRREVADRAVSFILSSFRDTEDLELLVNLALIAPDSSEVQNDPRAKYLSRANLDEIALISALLEIAESNKEAPSPEVPTAFGDPVFDYCRLAFKEDLNALPSLERLTAAEIIFVAENDDASVLIPRLSELAFLVALGRAGAELPRFPMPAIASVIFRTSIAPRLHQFVTCSYGIGYPRLLNAVTKGEKAHRAARPHHPHGRSTHSIFLRAEIEQQPFYAYSTFPDAETATLSAQDLQGAGGRHWGLHVDVNWVLQLPTGRVRSRRFLTALERVQFTPRPGLSFRSEVAKKADLLRHVRASCNRLERAVFDLEETISYIVLERDRDVMVVEVTGSGDGVAEPDTPVPDDYRFAGPYKWTELKQTLNLRSGERVSNVTISTTEGGYHDPKHVLESMSNKAREYNRSQPRIEISSSTDALQNALSKAQQDSYHDAQALCAVLSQYGDASLTPRRTLLLIHTHGEEGRYFHPHRAAAVYLAIPAPELEHDVVTVKVVERKDMSFDTEIFAAAFSEELSEIPVTSHESRDWRSFLSMANPSYLLCRELGYEDGAVGFHP
ncbi:hypothetical protein ACFC5H_15805 [Streptomyces rochei]|uniref:hypothetical protein n=1 Tax=Streptomyces TaxID=1883 RepID=UPI00341ECF0B